MNEPHPIEHFLKRAHQVIAAFKEGREAYGEGWKPCDNPYHKQRPELARYWASGYGAAKREATGRRNP